MGPSNTASQFNHGGKQAGAVPGNMVGPGQNKFINPSKMPMNTNYAGHRMSGGMPGDTANRVNDILMEQQKMIYAPPSREKSKQTVRSPMLEKAKTTSIGSQLVPADEYSAPMATTNMHH